MKKTLLQKGFKNGKVQCKNCSHYCILKKGEVGLCGVKENIEGVIYSKNYGKLVALNKDPIEKKPFYHFLPGSKSLSIASAGCPFSCKNCQNFEISQNLKGEKNLGESFSPEYIIGKAKELGCQSISYTYTDPITSLEYFLEIMKLAKSAGIKNNWVSAGFFSKESLSTLIPYLNAINVDLKSFSDNFYQEVCSGRLNPVLKNIEEIAKNKIWTEITTLIIPTLNDSEKELKKIAQFISEINSEIPWHLSRFSGEISYKLKNLPDTPISKLESAYEIGEEAGLKYIYLGNIPNSRFRNTYCESCKTLNLKREDYRIERYDKNGNCYNCNKKLNLILN